jgi:hypothetical protein
VVHGVVQGRASPELVDAHQQDVPGDPQHRGEPTTEMAESSRGMKPTSPRPNRATPAELALRQVEPDVVHLHDQPDDPVDQGGDAERDDTRISARLTIGWSATSLSEMTMISADRMKSVRTAPLTTVSSSMRPCSPAGSACAPWCPPPNASQIFSAPS